MAHTTCLTGRSVKAQKTCLAEESIVAQKPILIARRATATCKKGLAYPWEGPGLPCKWASGA